jgi:CRP-like cAMP-binding protein
MSEDIFSANALLATVEQPVRARFQDRLQRVELQQGQLLYSLGNSLTHVYFPLSGLVGILAETPDGDMIDSAFVGREGAVGAFEACGSRQFFAEAVVKVPGQAGRMTATAYRELFDESPAIRTAAHLYVEQVVSETRQWVACNSIHDLEARLCRTILEALDKSGLVDTLPLTQRTMARMLGAQRTTIAEILARLERDEVLKKRRGEIAIEDRAALERLSCGCRSAMRLARTAIWAAEEPACEAVIAAE